MPSSAPSPRLTRTTALAKAQALAARVQALVPTLTTAISPVTVYQPNCPIVAWGDGNPGTGNVLNAGIRGSGAGVTFASVGVWVAPDANGDGSDYQVQVECFAGGGGGGGGSTSQGGGGAGGAEYAAEPSYTITPGKSYVWVAARESTAGVPVSGVVSSGANGNPTIFDLLGVGLPGGVFANGGQGGDQGSTGAAGTGGTGSQNTIHAPGGNGGAVSAATGGGGGGASGGSGGAGGAGHAPSGATGGTGGTAASVPTALAATTTAGTAGTAGINGSTPVPAQGLPLPVGSGGGGSGNTPGAAAGGVATFSFPTAATYCGPDAGANAGTLYNPVQQGTQSILFAGAGPNDAATGAKNSILMLDPGVYSFLGFTPSPDVPGYWKTAKTPTKILLTVYNANPGNGVPVVMSVSVSQISSLPSTFTVDSDPALLNYLGEIVIPAGANSVTVDLTNGKLFTALAGGIPGKMWSLILGPAAAQNPSYTAYGQPASAAFNAEVYGPGSLAADGVTSIAPVLTITYSNTSSDAGLFAAGTTAGGVGQILLSYVNPEGAPVAGLQPFPTTDGPGNQWAQGLTGPVAVWDPVQAAGGVYKPEAWHNVAPPAGWSGTLRYRLTAFNEVEIDCDISNAGASAGAITLMTLTSPYYTPSATRRWATALLPIATSTATYFSSTFDVQASVNTGTTNLHFTQALPLN